MMLPAQTFLVPLYIMLSKLGWLDTPAALIIPATAGGFGVFMLSSFMRAIPDSIEEAAQIDGCSPWSTFWHVTLPCAPLRSPPSASSPSSGAGTTSPAP